MSVVVPVYNDARRLSRHAFELKEWLTLNKISYEIVVVDDGSADTEDSCRVAGEVGARFVRSEPHRGKGAAVRKGMLAAKGKYRFFTDADVPYEFEAMRAALSELKNGADMVVGDRSDARSSFRDETPLLRRITSWIFSMLVTRILKLTKSNDTQCGLKGFRDVAAKALFSSTTVDGFAFDVELFVLAEQRGFEIRDVPVRLRNQEISSLHVMPAGAKMFFDLLRIRRQLDAGLYAPPPKNTASRRAA